MKRIDELWAVVCENEEQGMEGLVALNTGGGWLPLVAADLVRLKQIEAIGHALSAAQGQPFKLIRLSTRTEIREINGREPQ